MKYKFIKCYLTFPGRWTKSDCTACDLANILCPQIPRAASLAVR
jgi:hypothetical protein